MPRYKVYLSKRADKFLSEQFEGLRLRILEETRDFENFPFLIASHDLAKIKGKEGYYRLRVGDIRLILKIDKARRVIYVEKIGRREAIYQ